MKYLVLAAAAIVALSAAAPAAAQSSEPRCWYAFKKNVHIGCVDGVRDNVDPDGTARSTGESDKAYQDRLSGMDRSFGI